MNIIFNSFSNQAVYFLKDVFSSMTRQKIFIIAALAFGCLACAYAINRCYLKTKKVSNDLDSDRLDDPTNWTQYLETHCDIEANCRLEDAILIFIGDQHADDEQDILRRNLVEHYAQENQIGENLVLLEGLDLTDFPESLGNKVFIVESWEQQAHYEEAGDIMNEHCQTMKEMNEKLKELAQLKERYKELHSKEDRKKIIDLIVELREFKSRLKDSEERSIVSKELRDQDLLTKAREKMTPHRKIFIFAGSNHLKKKDYKIIDAFHDIPCAVIIPKDTVLGEKKADKVLENMIRLGTYDEAYFLPNEVV